MKLEWLLRQNRMLPSFQSQSTHGVRPPEEFSASLISGYPSTVHSALPSWSPSRPRSRGSNGSTVGGFLETGCSLAAGPHRFWCWKTEKEKFTRHPLVERSLVSPVCPVCHLHCFIYCAQTLQASPFNSRGTQGSAEQGRFPDERGSESYHLFQVPIQEFKSHFTLCSRSPQQLLPTLNKVHMVLCVHFHKTTLSLLV